MISLSYGVPLDDHPTIKTGTYNDNNCGGSCDWCISDTLLEGAMISLQYGGEKYLYVFSFYGEVEGDLLKFVANNVGEGDDAIKKILEMPQIEGINEFVYLCDERLPNYDEFQDGVIYFSPL